MDKTDFKSIIKKLTENDFEFILIGGFAAAAYGSTFVTHDLDVCAILTAPNIEKLRKIFADVHPMNRIGNKKSSFLEVPENLNGVNNLYLETDIGVLDLLSNVTGVGDFSILEKSAVEVVIFGHKCKMISIDDLIKCKRTLKRSKDLEVASELEIIQRKLTNK
jgi:predicted nucleotidyltransferase